MRCCWHVAPLLRAQAIFAAIISCQRVSGHAAAYDADCTAGSCSYQAGIILPAQMAYSTYLPPKASRRRRRRRMAARRFAIVTGSARTLPAPLREADAISNCMRVMFTTAKSSRSF